VDQLDPKPASYGGFFLYVAVILAIVALRKILKTGNVVEPGADQASALAVVS
jgi:hypothetical protein